MEESISSSRTSYGDADCYASGGHPAAAEEDSEDSGWTAYFYDDDSYLQLLGSEEDPAATAPREKKPHLHGHGDRASASTVSTASRTRARAKKVGAEEEEQQQKKRPRRWEPADEDPLQDTASSQPENATRQVQLQAGWLANSWGYCDL